MSMSVFMDNSFSLNRVSRKRAPVIQANNHIQAIRPSEVVIIFISLETINFPAVSSLRSCFSRFD